MQKRIFNKQRTMRLWDQATICHINKGLHFFCGRNSKNGTEHYTVVHSQVAMTKTIHY